MDEPICSGCRQRDAINAELLRRVADLEAAVRDLQARLGQNSSNSSLPPSAKPLAKKKSGRRPGGPPGHPACLRRKANNARGLPGNVDRIAGVCRVIYSGTWTLTGNRTEPTIRASPGIVATPTSLAASRSRDE